MICYCFFPGDIYLSFRFSLSNLIFSVSSLTFPELFSGELLETFVIQQQFYSQSNHQLLLLFFELLFLRQLQLHLLQIVQHDQELSGCIYHLSFYLNFYRYFCKYFQQQIKLHNLLQIIGFQVPLNGMFFFIFYTLINN